MKQLRILTFVLLSIFVVASTSNAQPWKDLKNKAKKSTEKVIKKDDKTTKDNTTTKQSVNGTTTSKPISSSNTSSSSNKDDEFNAFVSEKDQLLYSYEDNLSKSQLERSEIKPGIHLAGIKKLDYHNTVAKFKAHARPEGNPGRQYDHFIAYQETYKTLFNDVFKNYINTEIEEAWKIKQYNEASAIEHITNAQNLAEAALIMLPDNEDVIKLKTDVDKSFENIAGAYYKKIFTSTFHKDNAGKILFSDRPIIVGEEDPAQFKTEFAPTDKIYSVAYLKGSIKDLTKDDKIGNYKLTIDGGNSQYISFGHNPEDMGLGFYLIEIVPHTDKAIHGLDCKEFAKILGNLSPRPHEFKLVFGGQYGKDLAEGTFKYDMTGVDGAKLKADAETASKNASDNYARNTKLPKAFSDPTSKFADPGLSETNMKALLMKEWSNCASIIKLGVYGTASEDWLIYKNNIDIPTHKATYREIKAIYKGKDGWCYFVEGISFGRTYTGGGKYANVKFLSDGRHVKIDCKNVK